MNKQTIGQLGEDLAVRHYQNLGFHIIARNTYNTRGKRLGELDFVAIKLNEICFVEVKTRTSTDFGLPEVSVTRPKQIKLVRAVQWFINKHPKFADFVPRIDVCAILLEPEVKNHFKGHIDKFVKYVKVYVNAVEMN